MSADGEFPTSPCRSCNAAVIWCTTGRRIIPVDAEPVSGGTVKVTRSAVNAEPVAAVVAAHRAFGRRDLRRAHVETCPSGASWRKPSAQRR